MIEVHLQPKQEELYDLITAVGTEVPTVIGGGGAKGGGKSRGTRSIVLQLAGDLGELHPGILITVVRRVYRDLKDNHIDPILRENPDLYRYWRAGDEQIAFGRQSTIAYRYAQNAEDVKRKFLGGYESAIIIVDEAQQFSQEELQWIATAARWTNPAGIPAGLCKVVFLFNPGGLSASFLRRIFWLKTYEGRERPGNYAFVHVFGWDNFEWFRGQVDISEAQFYRLPSICSFGFESLGHDYCCRFHLFVRETTEGQKYNAFPASIRRGYLLGDFEHFEGQYFAGVWDERRSTLTAHQVGMLLQYWHRRWMALDWGYGHHAACFWFASLRVGPEQLARILGIISDKPLDLIVCYREHVVSGVPEADLARDICARTPRQERSQLAAFVAGTDIFSERRGIQHTIAEQMEAVTQAEGLPLFSRADTRPGSRVQSARLVHAMLRASASMRSPEPPEQAPTQPMLLVGPECPKLQLAMPNLIADPDNLEDVLKLETMEDDIWDGFKYGVGYWEQAKPQAPVEVRRKEVYDTYDAPVKTTAQMTNLAMRMRQFDAEEKKSARRVIRRR